MIFFKGNIQGEKIDEAMEPLLCRGSAASLRGDTLLAGEQYKRSGELFEQQLQNLAKPSAANFNLVPFSGCDKLFQG